jgi:hypothetical protein
MATRSPTPTYQAVQAYYGKVAREAGSCRGDSAGPEENQNFLYPLELVAGLPVHPNFA